MTIYLPSLLDKFKDFVNGIKANWQEYEAHVDNTTDAHGIDDHFDATAEDDVHGLLSGGFIIEDFGSNDNGSWVRWSNGLQICWINNIIVNLSGVAAWGAVDHRWTFPKEFWGYTAVVDGMARGSGSLTGNVNLTFVGAGTAANNESVIIRVCLMNTTSTQTECYVNLKAVGWWKEPGT